MTSETNNQPTGQALMEPLNMWNVLVEIASQRYEELLEEERCRTQSNNQDDTICVTNCSYDEDLKYSDQSVASSADISIGENVPIGETDDEDEERLIIGEPAEDNASQANNFSKSRISTEHRKNESPMVHKSVPIMKQETSTNNTITPMRPRNAIFQANVNRCKTSPMPLTYNKNMARKYPGIENRTPKQHADCERNSIAARQSRARMRMMDTLLQQEAKKEQTHNLYLKERLASIFLYTNTLKQKLRKEQTDFLEEFERIRNVFVPGLMPPPHKRSQLQTAEENGIAKASSPMKEGSLPPVIRKLDLSIKDDTDVEYTDDNEADSVL